LIEHKERIKKIGKLNENSFIELYGLILQNIRIINHSLIPDKFYKSALDICRDIDMDDIPFVAINNYIRGKLWTGDIKLTNGLQDKGYKGIITTNELYIDFLQKSRIK
jgi:predicted nucleic acid-binding protein